MMRRNRTLVTATACVGLAGLFTGLLQATDAQPQGQKSTIVLNVTSGREDIHAVTMAYQLANHALDDGREALVFLNVRAADLARNDLPGSLALQGNPPVRSMLADLIKRGATVLVCPSCAKVMGVDQEDLAEGTAFATRESLFGRLGPNAVVFTY